MITLTASALRSPSSWRRFPQALIAAMLLVVAVNVRFIVVAVSTFPGAATADDFDTSNRYNAVLEQAAHDHALGWTTSADADGARPVLTISGAGGTPLTHATVTAEASRPLGEAMTRTLAFHEAAPGRYVASAVLPLPGQWTLDLQLRADGQVVYATRRIVLH